MINAAQRPSSSKRYNFVWSKFQLWYTKQYKKEEAHKASVNHIMEYMLNMYEAGAAFNTINTHKAILCATLAITKGVNYSRNTLLKSFVRGLKNSMTTKTRKIPDWNFQLVLQTLKQPPFEPLNEVDNKYLLMKTLFLSAWASAARISELQALTVEDGHFQLDKNNEFINLLPDNNFVAKNQQIGDQQRVFRIPALKNFTTDKEDLLLCPVRALRLYEARTREKRANLKRLFLTVRCNKELSIHGLSYWLRKCISLCYELTKPEGMADISRITPHEIRAVSTTLALNKHIPMKDIMRKAYWRSEQTFTKHYLKDITRYTNTESGITTIAAGFGLEI